MLVGYSLKSIKVYFRPEATRPIWMIKTQSGKVLCYLESLLIKKTIFSVMLICQIMLLLCYCLSYCTTNCTGWIYRSESTTNSAWLSTIVCSARLRHTWRISAHRSLISPVGSIYVRQEATSSMFHVTFARSSAVGPSLLRVRWPRTHCQTASEIRLCRPALSDVIWRLFSSPCTSAPAH